MGVFVKMEAFTKLADYFRKVPPAFLVAITTILGLILFLPEEIVKTLAVDEFRIKYRVWIGPTFLLAVLFLGARPYMYLRQEYFQWRQFKSMQKQLHQLTPEEKGYLLPYIKEQKNTIYVGPEDGIMNGLVAKGIICRVSDSGTHTEGFPFNLESWAREYLGKNTNLLEGHSGEPMTPVRKLLGPW